MKMIVAAVSASLLIGSAHAQNTTPRIPPGQAAAQTKPTPSIPSAKMDAVRLALETAPKNEIDDSKMSFAPGMAVPKSIRLQPVPAAVVAADPDLRGLEFFTGRTDYFLVAPSSGSLRYIVPKNTGF